MAKRIIDINAIGRDEDRTGNNAAFTCPKCGKVFLVSKFNNEWAKKGRPCPWCRQSTGYAPSDDKDTEGAYIEWEGNDPFWRGKN